MRQLALCAEHLEGRQAVHRKLAGRLGAGERAVAVGVEHFAKRMMLSRRHVRAGLRQGPAPELHSGHGHRIADDRIAGAFERIEVVADELQLLGRPYRRGRCRIVGKRRQGRGHGFAERRATADFRILDRIERMDFPCRGVDPELAVRRGYRPALGAFDGRAGTQVAGIRRMLAQWDDVGDDVAGHARLRAGDDDLGRQVFAAGLDIDVLSGGDAVLRNRPVIDAVDQFAELRIIIARLGVQVTRADAPQAGFDCSERLAEAVRV
jgi:hypothetical protein